MRVAVRRTELAFLAAVAALALAVAFARGGAAAPGDPELALVGRFTAPTYLTAPPGDRDRIFVVEQGGRIEIVRGGATLPTPFLDITSLVSAGGERGLLSLAFPPDYPATGRFYVYYTARNPSGTVTIDEFHVSGNADVADPGSRRTVLSIAHPRTNHNGGQLQFGPDGYLYIGTGDGGGGGDPDRAGQRLDTLLGKLLRIDPRPGPGGAPYTIPAGNPFAGQAGARPEIWSYGLRNPWRFSFDRQTGDLTIADVGQNQWEEIDLAPTATGAGRGWNFGWSCWEGRHIYEANSSNPECNPLPTNHVPPVWEYSHARGCSISGGYVVRDQTLPALAGRYVYGDYCDSPLWSAHLQTPDAQDDRRLGLSVTSLTSFGEDACGRVYAVSQSGPVYRLQAAGAAAGPCPVTKPVTKPVPRCRVPKVVGLKLAKARARIRRANCRVGRLRYERSHRARGRVLTQRPRPGAKRPKGARVALTLSRGRR
jgi:glucose/arabinose dehydrogenase